MAQIFREFGKAGVVSIEINRATGFFQRQAVDLRDAPGYITMDDDWDGKTPNICLWRSRSQATSKISGYYFKLFSGLNGFGGDFGNYFLIDDNLIGIAFGIIERARQLIDEQLIDEDPADKSANSRLIELRAAEDRMVESG